MVLPKKVLLALVPFLIQSEAQSSGTTTRYWDCCKPSCAWKNKLTLASGAHPVLTCDKDDNPLSDYDAKSGCDGGSAYMCTNQMPWKVNDDLAYGFAAVSIEGGNEASWCCACYELTFTNGPVKGKKMIVQATNTGGDLGKNHFDIAMPGGGFGRFDGCTPQWGAPSTGWGKQYGGMPSRSQCGNLDSKLKAGCYWRFDWFQNADNPSVSFQQVTCPAKLTERTGCVRAGEVPVGDPASQTQPAVKPIATKPVTTTANKPAVKQSTGTNANKPAVKNSPSTNANKPAVNHSPDTSECSQTETETVPQYGQCGGQGWTGGTNCVAPYNCKFWNQWYSQCL